MTEEELDFLQDTDSLLCRIRDYFNDIDEWLVLGGNKEEAWDNGWKAGKAEGCRRPAGFIHRPCPTADGVNGK